MKLSIPFRAFFDERRASIFATSEPAKTSIDQLASKLR